ncbi:AbiH family protein [Solobacterium moorei]|uniref:AbiH family protein n=1 Tax=Solobacterium moorei TaxID=102148 RepID=UPI0024AE40E1|nr:AbiH family protein [Solobacterium moorei]MDI6414860.1 AbiH family protein [Solobacterium moorei]
MKNKLFIIGNGFDLAHNLPTRFNPDFMNFAQKCEQDNFWNLYQTREDNIWSDFENLLGYPDLNNLEEIFDGYAPNYLSDRESDRDGIIYQVDLNGKLHDALYEFASKAENCLRNIQSNTFFEQILDSDGYYINFNYTHTLENIYHISSEQILHIHGEVGKNNLKLGYPQGNFKPEKYFYDVRAKGRGPYAKMETEDYINGIEDYYVRTAYERLLNKCKSFYKEIELDILKDFLDENICKIEEIVVYGHSCAIDFEYFKYLNIRYSNAHWKFYTRGAESKNNVNCMIKKYNISNSSIIQI